MSSYINNLKSVMNSFLYVNNKITFDNIRTTKILNYVENIQSLTKNKKDYNLNGLKKEFEKNYNKKSNNNKYFYTHNFLSKHNKNTGEVIDNSYINIKDIGQEFKFKDDFYFNFDKNIKDFKEIKTRHLKFQEKNEGQFLNQQDKVYSYKKLAKVKYLEYIYKDKEKVFITFTLPSEYHKYKKIGNNLIENENYKGGNYIDNIESGLKRLNEIHDYFYKLLKKYVARYIKKNPINDFENIQEIGFIKILEPHKNLQGHLHSLFYIDKEFLEILDNVYNLTIKKFELIQTKKEILKNAKSSTYLNKYLIKTTRSDERFYNEYKRYFSNTRLFTSSNYKYTSQEKIDIIYKYLSKNRPNLIKNYKKSNKPLYYFLELLDKKGFFEFLEVSKESISIDRKKLKDIYYKEYNLKSKEIAKLKNLDCEYKINGFKNIENIENNYVIDENGEIFNKNFNVKKIGEIEKNKANLQNASSELEKLEKLIIYNTIKQVYKCINKVKNKQIIKAYYKNNLIYDNNEWAFNNNKQDLLYKIIEIEE